MNELEQLVSDLVAINSINPDLIAGAPGEAAIGTYIARWLESAGLEVHVEEPLAGRPNVIGIARGTGGGQTLLLNGHVDTVGVGRMDDLLRPMVKDGRLYGRGAYDMKGGLAACMIAAAEARKLALRGDVIVTAVMDEEYAGLGTIAVAERYRPDGAIVAEPTELELVVAHKGFAWFDIVTQGVAAHGSRPHLGVDAIVKMGAVLVELDRLGQELGRRDPHPLVGRASIHASIIQGGSEMSSYPDRCRLSIERRTTPGETAEAITAEIQRLVERAGQEDAAFVESGLVRSPLETPLDASIVTAVRRAAESVRQRPHDFTGLSFWTDAASLWSAGIPTVLFGPAGAGAHAAEEWVDVASIQTCVDIFVATAKSFCG